LVQSTTNNLNNPTQCSPFTQTCYVLALVVGLVDGEKAKLAAKYLVENIEARDCHLSTGFIGTKDLMLALAKIGRNDVAYRLIHNDTFPSWGFSIKHGATSIWERWNGWTPETGFGDPGMNSFAHYSFGAVYQWMVENIGGIDSDGVGYKRIIIRPCPPSPGSNPTREPINWVKAHYDSIHGRIASNWRLANGRFELETTIPANTTAMVCVPAKSADAITESPESIRGWRKRPAGSSCAWNATARCWRWRRGVIGSCRSRRNESQRRRHAVSTVGDHRQNRWLEEMNRSKQLGWEPVKPAWPAEHLHRVQTLVFPLPLLDILRRCRFVLARRGDPIPSRPKVLS
jgi:hypothetical protein